jgi:2-C-methyl-D-erythritol 2,4-cyclodiphosphate synthase
MDALRIGTGFDVHRLVAGRPLVLGGVTIPYARGLAGHSDADVVLHALADALLGAAALGDLGQHFPPGDPRYAGADSRDLLRQVVTIVATAGWATVNADVTVIAEAPKLAPHVTAMRQVVAGLLAVPTEAVSIKATTTEGLGFTGRGEGIAAQTVVLLTAAPGRD